MESLVLDMEQNIWKVAEPGGLAQLLTNGIVSYGPEETVGHYMNSGDYSEGTEIPEGVYDVCEVDEYLGELITGTDAEVSFSFFSLWLSS